MSGFKRTERWLKYRFASHALILLYHRVTDLANDPFMLAVTPHHFSEQMEVIRKYSEPIRLQELVEALHRGETPNRAVVITFDDGYADNLHQAKPILERAGIPATVFVTGGRIGDRREFWWDELDRLLLQQGRLPNQLQMNIDGLMYEWELSNYAAYSEDDYQRDRHWHVERVDDPSPRHRLFRDLYGRLLPLPDDQREAIFEHLRTWAGAQPDARLTHRAMTSEELILMVQDHLIDAGAHTMTHPQLAALDEAEQRAEIQESKRCLEAVLNRPVTSFAYPNGSTTPATAAILQEAGFSAACSSDANAVWRGADVFRLPRLGVRDWDRTAFEQWYKYWIDG